MIGHAGSEPLAASRGCRGSLFWWAADLIDRGSEEQVSPSSGAHLGVAVAVVRRLGRVAVRCGLLVLGGATALTLAVAVAVAFAAPPTAAASVTAAPAGEESSCTRKPGVFKPGRTPAEEAEPIALTPDQPAETLNFGGGRGWKFIDVVLRAARPVGCTNSIVTPRLRIRGAGRRAGRAAWPAADEGPPRACDRFRCRHSAAAGRALGVGAAH